MLQAQEEMHDVPGRQAVSAEWWRTATIYQVYVRSFADSNGDGTGDLNGVRERLPYLHALGVDALWFNPWYPSPLADGGYDVADYRDIHPDFGTLEQAENLITEALQLGIRTIIDVVPNHVSSAHPWFQAALASEPGSYERSRFWFHPGRGAAGDEPPTRWESNFGGETWTRTTGADGAPGEWYLHLFSPEQPDLNWNSPDVRREHEEILRFWFDRGVAGVRIDSAALLVKDDALPEVAEEISAGKHPYTDRDELHDIYRSWRAVADSYPGARVLIGELWLPDLERFTRYLRPDELHTAFNFDFMTRPWDAASLRQSIQLTLEAHAPVRATPTWVLSNHDVTRPVTRYGREDSSFSFAAKRFGTATDLEVGTRRARAAFLLAAALPGALYIYQGDELGLPEFEDLPAEYREDPMYFRSGKVDPGRDGCRIPLPWSGARPPYGFGRERSQPWIPQPEDWADLTVESQKATGGSTLNLYRNALRIRHERLRSASPSLTWEPTEQGVLGVRRGKEFVSLTNLTSNTAELPKGCAVLLSSSPLTERGLPSDTTVWLLTQP